MEVKYFGSRYSKHVAEYCAALFQNSTCGILGSYHEHEGILVFPILGDNRIPEDVCTFLQHPNTQLPSLLNVLIVGDHDLDIYQSQQIELTNEIDFLVKQKRATLTKNPLLVDTPNIDFVAIQTWLKSPNHLVTLLQKPEINVPTQLQELIDLIGEAPRFKIVDGEIVEIKFFSYDPYPKPLVSEQSDWQLLNKTLLKFSNLERLSFAYSDIKSLPIDPTLLTKLVELDIRNTKIASFNFLLDMPNLRFLNISALNLDSFPNEVWQLSKLTSLYAYKNKITSIPATIMNLGSLQKLSLYRNNLSVIKQLPQSLQHLNVGGNPISQIFAHKTLNSLSIRHCDITQLPFDLKDFPNLTQLDVYKNKDFPTHDIEPLFVHL